jgi:hypothetical protein
MAAQSPSLVHCVALVFLTMSEHELLAAAVAMMMTTPASPQSGATRSLPRIDAIANCARLRSRMVVGVPFRKAYLCTAVSLQGIDSPRYPKARLEEPPASSHGTSAAISTLWARVNRASGRCNFPFTLEMTLLKIADVRQSESMWTRGPIPAEPSNSAQDQVRLHRTVIGRDRSFAVVDACGDVRVFKMSRTS